MNLQDYRQKRLEQIQQKPQIRELCTTCLQPGFSCYCPAVQTFDPAIKFAILIHPIELRRRIATGRMSHLTLQNSHLILGQDYSDNNQVNRLLADPAYYPVILYPGQRSRNVTPLSQEERTALIPRDRKLLVFVIDGTWATAKKMVRQSQNLINLPRLCFSPEKPSTFRVRKQPAPGCVSTIEAIHQFIELMGPACGFDTGTREHDKLLHVFDTMVERQLQFVETARTEGRQHRRYLSRASDRDSA